MCGVLLSKVLQSFFMAINFDGCHRLNMCAAALTLSFYLSLVIYPLHPPHTLYSNFFSPLILASLFVLMFTLNSHAHIRALVQKIWCSRLFSLNHLHQSIYYSHWLDSKRISAFFLLFFSSVHCMSIFAPSLYSTLMIK